MPWLSQAASRCRIFACGSPYKRVGPIPRRRNQGHPLGTRRELMRLLTWFALAVGGDNDNMHWWLEYSLVVRCTVGVPLPSPTLMPTVVASLKFHEMLFTSPLTNHTYLDFLLLVVHLQHRERASKQFQWKFGSLLWARRWLIDFLMEHTWLPLVKLASISFLNGTELRSMMEGRRGNGKAQQLNAAKTFCSRRVLSPAFMP